MRYILIILVLLLTAGCQESQSPSDVHQEGDNEMSLSLIRAAEAGDTKEVLRLLDEGANMNARDGQGRTPIMAATHGNRPDTVLALVKAGADINLQDNRSDNPFLYAGAEGLLDIVKIMIDAKADPKLTNRFGGTALIPAADRGHVEVVRELLEHSDIDVNHVNRLGWTALLEAIILGDGGSNHQKIVELLIRHGADVNLPDGKGVTPLRHALDHGYAEMASMLEEAGAKK